jgi:transcriptional regulator with XRE-family HTH domain
MSVRSKLNYCIKIGGWTTRKLALRASVSESTFREWLKGQRQDIAFDNIIAIARELQISLDWLAEDAFPSDVIPEWAYRPRALALAVSECMHQGVRTAHTLSPETGPDEAAPTKNPGQPMPRRLVESGYAEILDIQDSTELLRSPRPTRAKTKKKK